MGDVGDGDDSYEMVVLYNREFFDFVFFHKFEGVFDIVEGMDGD